MEIITALIAAVVAVTVTILDRHWVARDERRRWELTDRRHAYAAFNRASIDYQRGRVLGTLAPEERRAMSDAFGELLLIAPSVVRTAAVETFATLQEVRQNDEQSLTASSEARDRFLDVARADLGLPPNH